MRSFLIVAVCLVCSALVAGEAAITDEAVVALVDQTAADLTKDAAATIQKINDGTHPYKDKDNPEFYVFVYDTDVNMIAHPDKTLVGKNFKGKPDARGKKFRDLIVENATKSTTGWEDYLYKKPDAAGLFDKKAYFKLTTGSDGKKYVVVCGKYAPKK